MGEGVSECCLMPGGEYFSYIMARTSCISMRWWWWWWGSFCTRPRLLNMKSQGGNIVKKKLTWL